MHSLIVWSRKHFETQTLTRMVDNLVGFAATKVDVDFEKLPPTGLAGSSLMLRANELVRCFKLRW